MNKFILREWYIVAVVYCHHIGTGFILGMPSVMAPIITSNSTTDVHATKEEATWFIASYGLTGPLGFFTLPALMQIYGRKITNIAINVILLTGSTIIACAPDVTVLVLGRATHGIAFPGVILVCVLVSEYTHPKNRGFYVVFKMSGTYLGELLCHSLGLYYNWRTLAWLSIIPPVLGIIGTFKLVESPAWFAFVGRYKDCEESFQYLRGNSSEARDELNELLSAQQELRKSTSDYGASVVTAVRSFRSKEFLNPLLIAGLMVLLIQFSGIFFLQAYFIEIMIKLTKDNLNAYYFSMGSDILKIIGILLASYMVKIYSRRSILFVSGFFALVCLALTCSSSYLESREFLPVKWLTPCLLILYVFLSIVGFLSITVVSKGEIFPLQYRGLGVCTSGTIMATAAAITFKITGTMIYAIEVHGMLLVYLVICTCLLISLYFVMPETKDRTLQNIENDFFKMHTKLPAYGENTEILFTEIRDGTSTVTA